MATGSFNLAIVPRATAFNVGTAAARIVASSSLALHFTLVAPPINTVRIYIGQSSVSRTTGIPLAAGSVISFGPEKLHEDRSHSFDLAEFWAVATGASQVGAIVQYVQKKDK